LVNLKFFLGKLRRAMSDELAESEMGLTGLGPGRSIRGVNWPPFAAAASRADGFRPGAGNSAFPADGAVH
jgi:hypothetical protein